ncbi:sugar ABC transporter substrate-binding protein [Galbitalea soli]|uniref:Sugar ABC transporter substrate-binding protein n=1 Tax=Galbitalea soli TaxID=1268042 RepID=A0A7C9PMG8_9MICO|nr:sugar ABC transporter substrate-binding protein [Galbitalea soli]NEM90728.1 sugar ABC transporter substrate-binding protein [Galbitalea soli]NYJ31446.1 D-xylose transport system substrate-binding protein [Galbitalea soli]
MKIATTRAVLAAVTFALVAGMLAACSLGTASTGLKIGLLLPDSVTTRYDSADRPFFEKRIHELDPSATVLYANADGDAANQQQQAESMLTAGAKVLVLSPFDSKAAQAIVTESLARGVPVISYDRLIAGGKAAYYISFDNERVGEMQATALIEKLHSSGVPSGSGILEVNGSPTDANAIQFKAGAHRVLASSGYTTLAEFDTPGWIPSQAQDWVSGQITKYGDRITGVLAANDSVAGGVIAALKAAGLRRLPPVTGQDAELAGLQRILVGDQYMTVFKDLKPEADKAAELAIALSRHQKPAGQTTVDGVPSFLLSPVSVTAGTIADTVVKDGFYTAAQICTPTYAAACRANGLG